MTASIVYTEIPAPKMKETGEFYAKVFGWDVDHSIHNSEDYCAFSTGKDGLSGAFSSCYKAAEEGGALLYLSVENIPAALRLAQESGGEIVQEKMSIGEHGFVGYFRDPSGNKMGVWSKD